MKKYKKEALEQMRADIRQMLEMMREDLKKDCNRRIEFRVFGRIINRNTFHIKDKFEKQVTLWSIISE